MKRRLAVFTILLAYGAVCLGGGAAMAYAAWLAGVTAGAPSGFIAGVGTLLTAGIIWVLTGKGLDDIVGRL